MLLSCSTKTATPVDLAGLTEVSGDGNAYQMDQGQAETNGNGGETPGPAVCRAQDDEQEQHHRVMTDLTNQGGDHAAATGRVQATAIGGETLRHRILLAAGDHKEDSPAGIPPMTWAIMYGRSLGGKKRLPANRPMDTAGFQQVAATRCDRWHRLW